MRELLGDVRYGLRLLLRNAGVTAIALLALALGIGANTAIFSVLHAVLLRPLPVSEPDRLITIRIDHPQRNIRSALGPYPDVVDWGKQGSSFDAMSAFSPGSANLLTRDYPERVSTWSVNASFFPMLGVRMAVGRGFLPEEDQPGAGRVAILSHKLWRERFGSDRGLVGRPIVLDGEPFRVVGVTPSGFDVAGVPIDLYKPIALTGVRGQRDRWSYGAFARLKPGVSIQQAQAELDSINRRLESQYPKGITGFRARIWGLREFMVRDLRLSLMVLAVAVGLVLLIACSNVANLMLARTSTRMKELATRAALGAGRWRLTRQLLTESLLMAVAGGLIGLLLASWGVSAIVALGGERYPLLKQSRLDLPVLGFTLAISLATGLLFGVAPALAVPRSRVNDVLKASGRGSAEGRGTDRLRGLLVVWEVALALVLLIGATLLIRSLVNIRSVNPGFDPSGVLTAFMNLPVSKYTTPEQQAAFYRDLEERLRNVPGVSAAGMTSVLPLSGNNQGMGLLIEGRPVRSPADVPILFHRAVNTKYFQSMRIPLRRGRVFNERDSRGAPRVLIVNETTARRFWPGEDPIGKRVGNGAPDGWITVVGVVGDLHHMSLDQDPDPEIFLPFAQTPRPDMLLTIRTTSDPARFAPALRQLVVALDREQPVARVASMEQTLLESIAAKRLSATLLGILAAVALTLATVGIYGVVSFSVTRRTQEIGVRMALGAQAGDVLRMVVRRAVVLALAGVLIGLIAASALTRLVSGMLFGVRPTDSGVFAGVSLLLVAVAAIAGYFPARRAARVDPMAALRQE